MNENTPQFEGPQIGDAFGAALLACWETNIRPNEVLELIERDDGFLDGGDIARYFAGPGEWHSLDHWVCDRAQAAQGRVLDIGSGAGRIALHLQERELDITALDVSPLAIDVCRQRGVRQTFTGSVFDLAHVQAQAQASSRAAGQPQTAGQAFVQAMAPGQTQTQGQVDIRQPFDAFLLMGNNLGLLGGVEQAPRFLHTLATLASPGAVLLGLGMDPYRTTRELHLAYHARNRTRGRMGGQICMRMRHQQLATDWFDYLFATIDELRSLLVGTAWRLEHHEPQADGGASYAVRLRLSS